MSHWIHKRESLWKLHNLNTDSRFWCSFIRPCTIRFVGFGIESALFGHALICVKVSMASPAHRGSNLEKQLNCRLIYGQGSGKEHQRVLVAITYVIRAPLSLCVYVAKVLERQKENPTKWKKF